MLFLISVEFILFDLAQVLKMQLLWFAVTGARGAWQTRININRSRKGWMKTGHEPCSRYKVSKLTTFLINDLKSPFDAFSLIPSVLYFCLHSSHFISVSPGVCATTKTELNTESVVNGSTCHIHVHLYIHIYTHSHTHTGTYCICQCIHSHVQYSYMPNMHLLHYFSSCTNVYSEAMLPSSESTGEQRAADKVYLMVRIKESFLAGL